MCRREYLWLVPFGKVCRKVDLVKDHKGKEISPQTFDNVTVVTDLNPYSTASTSQSQLDNEDLLYGRNINCLKWWTPCFIYFCIETQIFINIQINRLHRFLPQLNSNWCKWSFKHLNNTNSQCFEYAKYFLLWHKQ